MDRYMYLCIEIYIYIYISVYIPKYIYLHIYIHIDVYLLGRALDLVHAAQLPVAAHQDQRPGVA